MTKWDIIDFIENMCYNALVVLGVFLYFAGVIILIVLSPIWILPYLVYKKVRYGHF